MNTPKTISPQWEDAFKNEFGIHFKDSAGELQFALEFIREEIEKAMHAHLPCPNCPSTPNPQNWEERFNKQFGTDGEEKNCDSIGRKAGCDDCSHNIEERQEYKSFIRQELSIAEQRGAEKEREKCEVERYLAPCSGCKDGHPSFWKTVVESPQWKAWATHAEKEMLYDIPEVVQCGIISPRHFQDFLYFTHLSETNKTKE